MLDNKMMPKLGFGLMRLPEKDGMVDIPQVSKMVDAYMASGFNYFDTAYLYHKGASETAIKSALVDRYPRNSFYLTTKLPAWILNNPEDRDRVFNEQLERCGVDYFDFYFLHSVEDGANYEACIKYDCFNWCIQKKAEGKIKHFGMSFHGSPELLEQILCAHPEIEVVQIQLNYADWDNPVVQSGKLYQILLKHKIPIFVMEPVKGGMLANLAPEWSHPLKALSPHASDASWALRFVASLEGIVTVLSGMSNEEQVIDNLKTFVNFKSLNPSEKNAIAQVVQKMQETPLVQCTSCRYCCDGCPTSIRIPDVFRALNTYRLYPNDTFRAKAYYARRVVKDAGMASDCIACGQCESVCPQHLPIIELLQEAAKKLEN